MHLAVATPQGGVDAVHCALLVHPAMHLKLCGAHTGAEAPQSAFDKHWTHEPSPKKHLWFAGVSIYVSTWNAGTNMLGGAQPRAPCPTILLR
jgi:hypothetical protein